MIDEKSGVTASYATSDMNDPSRKGGTSKEVVKKESKKHNFDSQACQALLNKIREWHDHELDIQSDNRYQMALDCDYYDGAQWSEEDALIVMSRNQAPLVFNEIKPTIDWMLGTERRTRIDFKVLPRKSEKEASTDAENKTQLLKYLNDVNKSVFAKSMAFDDCVKAGVGWLEVGVRGDPTDELSYMRNENWRNMIHDSNSVEMDYSDARYVFRKRWVDDDIAIAYFSDRAHIIKQSVVNSDQLTQDDEDDVWYMGARVTAPGEDYSTGRVGRYMPFSGTSFGMSSRPRTKLIECWYKAPVLKKKFRRGDYAHEIFDKSNQAHIDALNGGYSLYDKIELQVRCAIYCNAGLLFDGESPYDHGRFPFVPVWCYRRKRDNQPYGHIRALRDPQDDLNKRHSKAQWILSTNRVVLDKGAVDDLEELRDEVARPDSVIEKNQGKELKIERDTSVAQQHIQLMEVDVAHIRNAGAVNSENLGRQTNTTSGIALQERKEAGAVATTAPFDNLRFAWQLAGELQLANTEQFYTEEKTVRIIGDRGNAKFVNLNKVSEDGAILNDITEFQADFIVSEQDYRSSLRQAMFESMFDIVGRLAQMNPEVALKLLDLVVEMADLPNKDELVSRIRKINGESDPDKEESDEEVVRRKAQEQKAAALADVQEKIALKTMETQLAKLVSQKEKLDSDTLMQRIKAIYSSLQAAGTLATVPAAAPIADEILTGAGYKDTQIKDQQEAIDSAAAQMQPGQEIPAQNAPSPAEGLNAGMETQQIEPQGEIQ